MNAEIFVDTNILYYANTMSADARHERARERLRELWQRPERAAISVQVAQELHVNLIRKAGLDFQASAQRIRPYLSWQVVDNDRRLLEAAFAVQQRWQLSFWDALILSAAQRSGASVLWTEDLATNAELAGVLVLNPLA